MKKTLSLLTLATIITAFSAQAHAENLFVNNQTGRSMEVTITENVDEADKVKDTFCLMSGTMQYLSNYTAGKEYKVTADLKNGYCDGAAIKTVSQNFHMPSSDMKADINENYIDFQPR